MDVAFKEILAEHIAEVETFDFDLVEPELGFKNIHWMIANSYLDKMGYSLYQKVIDMEKYVGAIKRSLYPAKEVLESRGIRVYFVIPLGKKLIKVITTDSKYKDASEEDYKRMLKRNLVSLQSVQSQLVFRHPTLIEERRNLLSDYRRLNNSIRKELTA